MQKYEQFVLDCNMVDVRKSAPHTKDALDKMSYNGLADKYLRNFFARESKRKDL